MPEMSNPNVDIGSVEAEITDTTREVQEAASRGSAPSPEAVARQMRELMAREAWRIARLSAN